MFPIRIVDDGIDSDLQGPEAIFAALDIILAQAVLHGHNGALNADRSCGACLFDPVCRVACFHDCFYHQFSVLVFTLLFYGAQYRRK